MLAEFHYQGSMQGVPDFSFPSLATYVRETREKLQAPLVVQEYAVAGEREGAKKVLEIIREKPYQQRSYIGNEIKRINDSFQEGTLRPVPFGEYPELYKAAQFTVKVSRQFAKMDVIIQIYREKVLEDRFQALAVGYLDKGWLFISERFFMHPNTEMLKNAEVCFLLGHELGHAQCRHTTIEQLNGVTLGVNVEYSADRAGLLVCAKWLLEESALSDPAQAIEQAVLCGIAALEKITLAYAGFIDWRSFDYNEVAGQLKAWRDAPTSLGPDVFDHPADERRGLAMYYFSQSAMFWRLLGLEPREGLLTDALLQDLMNTLLKK